MQLVIQNINFSIFPKWEKDQEPTGGTQFSVWASDSSGSFIPKPF